MKRLLIGLVIVIGTACTANAQNGYGMKVDRTYIPSPPNATWQNNSQFYNKDNQSIAVDPHVITNSNGTYWAPGYSNEANRQPYTNGLAPNTSVNTNTSGNSYYNNTINTNSQNMNTNGTGSILAPSTINSNVYRP